MPLSSGRAMDRPFVAHSMKAAAHYSVGLALCVGYGLLTRTNYELVWLFIMGMVASLCLFRLRSAGRLAVVELALSVTFGLLGLAVFRVVGL